MQPKNKRSNPQQYPMNHQNTERPLRAQAYTDKEGNVRFFVIVRVEEGLSFRCLDHNLGLIKEKTHPFGDEKEFEYIKIALTRETNTILVTSIINNKEMMLVLDRDDPTEILKEIELPNKGLHKTSFNNSWVGCTFLENKENIKVLSMCTLNLATGAIFSPITTGMRSTTTQIAMMGDSESSTCCYLVYKQAGHYCLTWFHPTGFEENQNVLEFVNINNKDNNLILMETYEKQLIIIFQDGKETTGKAIYTVFVLEHPDKNDLPNVKNNFTFTFHAPVYPSIGDGGFLLLTHFKVFAWIDFLDQNLNKKHIRQLRNTYKKEDGNIDRFASIRDKTGEITIILWDSWINEKGDLELTVIRDGKITSKIHTFDLTDDVTKVKNSRTFSCGNHFFASIVTEERSMYGHFVADF